MHFSSCTLTIILSLGTAEKSLSPYFRVIYSYIIIRLPPLIHPCSFSFQPEQSQLSQPFLIWQLLIALLWTNSVANHISFHVLETTSFVQSLQENLGVFCVFMCLWFGYLMISLFVGYSSIFFFPCTKLWLNTLQALLKSAASESILLLARIWQFDFQIIV